MLRAHHASGIFGAPAARPVTTRESITKSSIDGGLFGGQPAEAENQIPTARRAAPAMAKDHVAGFKVKEAREASVPTPGANGRDPNRSSVQGGIFGNEASLERPMSARTDPNRSSIQGGIFG